LLLPEEDGDAAMIETALLGNAAATVVASFLKRRIRGGDPSATVEVPPEVLQALEAQLDKLEHDKSPGVFELSREAAKPEHLQAESRTAAPDVGAAALSISPNEVFREARTQNKRVFMVGLVLAVTLASILVIGIGGVIVSAAFFGKESAAATFGGVSLLDVVGLALTKPFAVIQGASVTSQRLDLAYLRLQEELKDCADYADADERFRCKSRVWDQMQEELRKLSAG
jgi:hypothetical protein